MTCLLEMRDAMVKLLPDVLLNLSKISATVHVAIPTLEFLSSTFSSIEAVLSEFYEYILILVDILDWF